jgi:hypothetical protein
MEFKEEYSVPLAVHPTKHNVIYSAVANGQPGQWRKRNGDAQAYLIQSRGRWQDVEQIGTARCRRQAIASLKASLSIQQTPIVLYAAQRNGDLFGSEDSGDSWFKMMNVPELSDIKAAHA